MYKENYLFMDESDRPYEKKENSFLYSKKDEEFDNMIIEKFDLEPRSQIRKDGVLDIV